MFTTPLARKCAVMLGLLLAFASSAWALERPGIDIPFEFWQNYVPLPDSYAKSDPAIYEGAQKVLDIWKRINELRAAYEKSVEAHRIDTSLDRTSRVEKMKADKATYESTLAELRNQRLELRRTMIYLIETRLLQENDPYLLLWLAQLYLPVRDEPPELWRAELAKLASAAQAPKAAPEVAANAAKAKAKAPEAEKKPEAPAPAAAAAPEGAALSAALPERKLGEHGSPAVFAEQTNIRQRIIALAVEIRERFPQFAKIDYANHTLAGMSMEIKKPKRASVYWREILGKTPQSEFVPEANVWLGEITFDDDDDYEHFMHALEFYDKALTHYKNGIMRTRLLYRRAWAIYLSPELSEDALDAFKMLYEDLKAAPVLDEDRLAMKAEALEVARRITAPGTQANSRSAFDF